MALYRIFYTTTASASAEVEADDFDAANELAYDLIPRDVCAQCSGWSQPWSLELAGDWDDSEDGYMVDGEWIDGAKP